MCANAPLTGPQVHRWRGFDRTTFLTFVMFLAATVVLIFWYLLPYNTVLRETQSALRGGEQDFVFAVGATGLPMWSVFRGDWAPLNGSGQCMNE